jgi:hypothetical protein
MEKIASEKNGYITKTSNYGNVYMDQHRKLWKQWWGVFSNHHKVLLTIETFIGWMNIM